MGYEFQEGFADAVPADIMAAIKTTARARRVATMPFLLCGVACVDDMFHSYLTSKGDLPHEEVVYQLLRDLAIILFANI